MSKIEIYHTEKEENRRGNQEFLKESNEEKTVSLRTSAQTVWSKNLISMFKYSKRETGTCTDCATR